jgi:hypothetical protein
MRNLKHLVASAAAIAMIGTAAPALAEGGNNSWCGGCNGSQGYGEGGYHAQGQVGNDASGNFEKRISENFSGGDVYVEFNKGPDGSSTKVQGFAENFGMSHVRTNGKNAGYAESGASGSAHVFGRAATSPYSGDGS